jgi:hypothetical protein
MEAVRLHLHKLYSWQNVTYVRMGDFLRSFACLSGYLANFCLEKQCIALTNHQVQLQEAFLQGCRIISKIEHLQRSDPPYVAMTAKPHCSSNGSFSTEN